MKRRLKYDWVQGSLYFDRIYAFLLSIDDIMIPRLSERVSIREYAEKLSKCSDTLFVMQGETDIGACSVYCNRQEAFVSSIALKREFLYQNIGTKMMEEVKSHTQQCGCKVLQLKVHEMNVAAIGYYKKNGFQKKEAKLPWILLEYKLKD